MAFKIVTCAYNFPGPANCESSTREYFLLTQCLQNSPFVCHVPRLVQFRAESTSKLEALVSYHISTHQFLFLAQLAVL